MVTAKEAKNRINSDVNINTVENISNKIFKKIEKATIVGRNNIEVKIPFAANILEDIIERFEILEYSVDVEKKNENIYTIVRVFWGSDEKKLPLSSFCVFYC